MATNLQRFTSSYNIINVTVDLRHLWQVMKWESDCW